jgi:hypothetical protein
VTTSLATIRDDLFGVLDAVGDAQTYRGKRTNYEYPAFVISPRTMDVRPAMGTPRDYIIDVLVGVEVTDEDGSEDQLDILADQVLVALQENPQWDIREAEAGDALSADSRIISWWRIEVAVFE